MVRGALYISLKPYRISAFILWITIWKCGIRFRVRSIRMRIGLVTSFDRDKIESLIVKRIRLLPHHPGTPLFIRKKPLKMHIHNSKVE